MTLIPVTEEHISRGRPLDSSSCPIALALIDEGCEEVEAAPEGISCWVVPPGPGGRIFGVSRRVVQFMEDFDADCGKPPEPFTLVEDGGVMRTLSEHLAKLRR